MKKIAIILLLILIIKSDMFSRIPMELDKSVNERIIQLLNEADKLVDITPDIAFSLANSSLSLSIGLDDELGAGYSELIIGRYYMKSSSDYSDAIKYLEKGMERFNKIANPKAIVTANLYIADFYKNINDKYKFFNYIQESLEIAGSNNLNNYLLYSYKELIKYYKNNGKKQKANDYLDKSSDLILKNINYPAIASQAHFFAEEFYKNSEYDKSLKILLPLINMDIENSDIESEIKNTFLASKAFRKNGKIKKADEFFKNILNKIYLCKDHFLSASIYAYQAKLDEKKNQNVAIENYHKALELFLSAEDKRKAIEILEILTSISIKLKDNAAANKYLARISELSSKLNKNKPDYEFLHTSGSLIDMKSKLAKKQQKIKDIKAQKDLLMTTALVIFVIFGIIAAFLLVKIQKQLKIRSGQIEDAEARKNEIYNLLAVDIKNVLFSFSVEMSEMNNGKNENLNKTYSKFIKKFNTLLSEFKDI